MNAQPQFETPHDTIKRLWSERWNTYDIAVYLSQQLGESVHESDVCRILHAIRANQAKGGAQ